MPDTKISNLTELAEAPASTDEFVIVDKSDTTMAASGTTKKIQSQYVIIADATASTKGKALLTEGQIHSATSKTTPVDADKFGIVDSEASNILKSLTWANLKATLKTYFDTLYSKITITNNDVDTSQTTTSTSYTNLSTNGPEVTVTIGSSGMALVSIFSYIANSVATANSFVGFAISGSTTVAASEQYSIKARAVSSEGSDTGEQIGATFLVSGLTAGSNTFTLKYKVNTGTGTFRYRKIIVKPI